MINSGSHLIQREPFQNSLIQIIGLKTEDDPLTEQHKETWYLTLANIKLTENHPSKEALLQWCDANEWHLLTILCTTICQLTIDANNPNNNK